MVTLFLPASQLQSGEKYAALWSEQSASVDQDGGNDLGKGGDAEVGQQEADVSQFQWPEPHLKAAPSFQPCITVGCEGHAGLDPGSLLQARLEGSVRIDIVHLEDMIKSMDYF